MQVRVKCAKCGKRQYFPKTSAENALFALREGHKKCVKCKSCGIVLAEYGIDGKIQLWYGAKESKK